MQVSSISGIARISTMKTVGPVWFGEDGQGGVSLEVAGLLILLGCVCVYSAARKELEKNWVGMSGRSHIHYQGRWLPLDMSCCLFE